MQAVIQLNVVIVTVMLVVTACGHNAIQQNANVPTVAPNSTSAAQSRCGLMTGLDDLIIQACLATEETYPRRESQQIEASPDASAEFDMSITEYEAKDRWQTRLELPNGN